jgi:hypothetical protein
MEVTLSACHAAQVATGQPRATAGALTSSALVAVVFLALARGVR